MQCPSAQSPFLSLALLFTFPAMGKVKAPPARGEEKYPFSQNYFKIPPPFINLF
jgi:hypothetical protein